LSPTRRDVLTATTAVVATSLLPTALCAETMDDRIRPFRVGVLEEQLVDRGSVIVAAAQKTG
jgi:hypothetical protein